MARKLPWAGNAEPPPKRARKQDRTSPPEHSPQAKDTGRTQRRQTQIQMSPSTPKKHRAISRSPSTSPPPGPPEVEPMQDGYDEDDIFMMVEDEFQSLAQTFTAHLHHAEYKRLMRKAREAPRRELPDPQSPMSKETKRKLQRGVLDRKQQDALERVGARNGGDVEDDNVDDPWRGTALAGLVALSSQEKRSLKGLEKMPSSTRAAQGFSKAEAARPRKLDAIDLLTRPPEQRSAINLSRKAKAANSDGGDHSENQNMLTAESTKPLAAEGGRENSGRPTTSENPRAEERPYLPQSSATARPIKALVQPSTKPRRPPPSFLVKRKKVKEENKEDRLAEVPMFLI